MNWLRILLRYVSFIIINYAPLILISVHMIQFRQRCQVGWMLSHPIYPYRTLARNCLGRYFVLFAIDISTCWRRPEYSRSRLMPWLLMPWPFAGPSHQMSKYCLYRIIWSLSCVILTTRAIWILQNGLKCKCIFIVNEIYRIGRDYNFTRQRGTVQLCFYEWNDIPLIDTCFLFHCGS